jgi:hypothetical protein
MAMEQGVMTIFWALMASLLQTLSMQLDDDPLCTNDS